MAGDGEPCTQLHHSLLGTMPPIVCCLRLRCCASTESKGGLLGMKKCLKGTLEQMRTCQEGHCLFWGRKQELVELAGSGSCNSLEARSPDLEEGKE